ncbi:ATP-binding protein [Pantanalinema rosaneae CENA516]|uniref:hybrid sensor histidine kinase/response regulator n=1 Tax=Pantanalinema rosaneae TaxID=1620701 RepID=UPI003D6DFD10
MITSHLPVEPIPSSSTRILIVEDETIVATDVQECLENLGYLVPAIAVSGEEAIRKATELHPDLILMDIRLRGELDGIQAAEQIWKALQIPIVYATGYSDRHTLRRATGTAAFGYVLKPLEERELYVAIETALQRFRLDTELKQREEWLATILNSIGDGVIVADTQEQIKFLNPVAERLTGWQQADAIDRRVTEVLHIVHEQTGVRIPSPVTKAIDTGTIVYLANRTLLISRTGAVVPIADSVAPFRDDQGTVTGVVLVFRDVTEHQYAEERHAAVQRAEQLEHQMTELQRLSDLKDDFLSTVSHELRTPLSNIKMAIHMLELVLNRQGLLQAEINAESDRTIRYLEILRDQCNQELTLVNDLLDMQKLNANAYTLELTPIQLQHWLPRLADNYTLRIRSAEQQLQVNVLPDLPTLTSDLASLTRIIAELLENACKYTPPGETIALSVQPVVATFTATITALQIRVTNTGITIPPDEQPRIFDQFYRIPQPDRWGQSGTGLGLALVQKLVGYLGGNIWVESDANVTCFIVELPLIPASPIDRTP